MLKCRFVLGVVLYTEGADTATVEVVDGESNAGVVQAKIAPDKRRPNVDSVKRQFAARGGKTGQKPQGAKLPGRKPW